MLTSAIYDPVSSSNCIMDTIQEITAGGNWRGKTVVIPTAPVFTESCGCVKSDKNKNDQKLEQLFITSEMNIIITTQYMSLIHLLMLTVHLKRLQTCCLVICGGLGFQH